MYKTKYFASESCENLSFRYMDFLAKNSYIHIVSINSFQSYFGQVWFYLIVTYKEQ